VAEPKLSKLEFQIMEALWTQGDLLALFGGRSQPVMAHLIESGKLTMDDVKEAEKALRKLERKEKP